MSFAFYRWKQTRERSERKILYFKNIIILKNMQIFRDREKKSERKY